MLVDAGTLIGTNEFLQRIDILLSSIAFYDYLYAGNRNNRTGVLGKKHLSAVPGDFSFHTGGHNRRLGAEQRYRLTLHIGSHQSTVGIVMLKERD
jgi:hypothetical protein